MCCMWYVVCVCVWCGVYMMWCVLLGIKSIFSCIIGKHFFTWTVSPRPLKCLQRLHSLSCVVTGVWSHLCGQWTDTDLKCINSIGKRMMFYLFKSLGWLCWGSCSWVWKLKQWLLLKLPSYILRSKHAIWEIEDKVSIVCIGTRKVQKQYRLHHRLHGDPFLCVVERTSQPQSQHKGPLSSQTLLCAVWLHILNCLVLVVLPSITSCYSA